MQIPLCDITESAPLYGQAGLRSQGWHPQPHCKLHALPRTITGTKFWDTVPHDPVRFLCVDLHLLLPPAGAAIEWAAGRWRQQRPAQSVGRWTLLLHSLLHSVTLGRHRVPVQNTRRIRRIHGTSALRCASNYTSAFTAVSGSDVKVMIGLCTSK